jgi:hypothetical protein
VGVGRKGEGNESKCIYWEEGDRIIFVRCPLVLVVEAYLTQNKVKGSKDKWVRRWTLLRSRKEVKHALCYFRSECSWKVCMRANV